jgi:hypothetical protein
MAILLLQSAAIQYVEFHEYTWNSPRIKEEKVHASN